MICLMKLDTYIKISGLTQAGFAAKAGVTEQTLRNIRRSDKPSARTLQKIIKATHGMVSGKDFFGYGKG